MQEPYLITKLESAEKTWKELSVRFCSLSFSANAFELYIGFCAFDFDVRVSMPSFFYWMENLRS